MSIGLQSVEKPESRKHGTGIGGELKPGTDFRYLAGALKQNDFVPLLLQGEGGAKTADAATCNNNRIGALVGVGHEPRFSQAASGVQLQSFGDDSSASSVASNL